ncbi:MAG: LemA family protein [Treponema sp.]
MGKTTKIILIILAIVVICLFSLYSFFAGNYNKFVRAEEQVKAAWAQVENVYQRRLDLVPNLVEVVKGYAKHEEEVLAKVVEARSKAGGVVNISEDVLNNPESFEKFQKAQSELSSSLQRLLAVSEAYPDLKANENFIALQSQLEGTENRITVERKRYNDACNAYNTTIRLFPSSIIANMNGFREKPYFRAEEQASKAPKVQF